MLKSLAFSDLGYGGGDDISVEVLDGVVTAAMKKIPSGHVETKTLSKEESEKWLADFETLHVETWKEEYRPDGMCYYGGHWKLEYSTDQGESRKIQGNSVYPENWSDFLYWIDKVAPQFNPETIDRFELVCRSSYYRFAEFDDEDVAPTLGEEIVALDRRAQSVKLERKKNGKTKKTFSCQIDEFDLENICFAVSMLGESSGKNSSPEINCTYELSISYHALPPKIIRGSYEPACLPSGWKDFLEALYGIQDLRDVLEIIPHLQGESEEYIYCSVALGEEDRTWYYRTEDATLTVGDYVIVPWGKANKRRLGQIKKAERFKKDDVPFDLEHTKLILSRAGEDEFEKGTGGPLSYEFQKLMKDFEWRQKEFIAERWNNFQYTLRKLGYDKAEYLEYTKGRKLEDAMRDIGAAPFEECCAWLTWILWGESFREGLFKECLYNGSVNALLRRACTVLEGE